VEAVLADCKEGERMLEVMQRFKPDIVFHAAAYKHVALMEANPLEAVRNNAIATRVTAETAAAAGTERFVLVSTDKAVNPRTVMGASKAMAEWITEAAGQRHAATRFISVRFGNVLASSGSAVPIFRSQIEKGGPVTVTHPDMARYFMTIHEAVQLVIQAGDLGAGAGDVFVLEMGEPVRILDLARNMITLAGYEPDVDVAIEFIGPRPGEKLREELFNGDERSQPTTAERIVRAVRTRPLDPDWVVRSVDRLETLVAAGDEAGLAERVVEVVDERLAESSLPPSYGRIVRFVRVGRAPGTCGARHKMRRHRCTRSSPSGPSWASSPSWAWRSSPSSSSSRRARSAASANGRGARPSAPPRRRTPFKPPPRRRGTMGTRRPRVRRHPRGSPAAACAAPGSDSAGASAIATPPSIGVCRWTAGTS
jgi:nucleoside-diphosphate-sugar epimerase